MRRVILESPFAGNVTTNLKYARRCVRDSVMRGEAPLASHLLYTQDGILNDNVPEERTRGIDAGHAWLSEAAAMVVYQDRGISNGMKIGIERAMLMDIPVEFRSIGATETPELPSIHQIVTMLAEGPSSNFFVGVIVPTGTVAGCLMQDILRVTPYVKALDKRRIIHSLSGAKLQIFVAQNHQDIDRACNTALAGRNMRSPIVLFEMVGPYQHVGDQIGMIAEARGHAVHRMEFPPVDLFTRCVGAA